MQKAKCVNNFCEDALTTSKELLAWEKWIQIRKEETEHLAKNTGRPPLDLTMNTIESLREDKERKTVLEHAQIQKKAVLRNSFWEQPERLKQKCCCDPVYEVQRTKAEIGCPRIIEYIGVPQLIQATEKGLAGISQQKPYSHLDATYKQYKKKRENELQHEIKKIDPYRPEINNLIVTGTKPKSVQKLGPVIPKVEISSEISSLEHATTAIYALQINKSIFYKDLPQQDLKYLRKMQKESWHEVCTSWSYYFNTSINKVGRAKLLIRNLGTVSLRYCWKEIKIPLPFMPEICNEQVFFFNKNEDIIYPGQERNICFTFISNKPDIYHESWEISFYNVSFLETLNDKFIVNLSADARENLEVIKKKVNKLKIAIQFSALKTMIRSLIEEMITKAVIVEHQIYPYKNLFVEAEIFEMKNPICFYHQSEVAKLKKLYTEMTPGEIWDLTITSWRQAMMNIKYDNRIKYYELLQKSHRELVKPWIEGENLLEQKYKAVSIVLGQLADKFYEEYLLITMMIDFNNQEIENINCTTSNQSLFPNLYSSHIFYMRIYDHIGVTIETCAGILSSLDLNKWIHFDFCKK